MNPSDDSEEKENLAKKVFQPSFTQDFSQKVNPNSLSFEDIFPDSPSNTQKQNPTVNSIF